MQGKDHIIPPKHQTLTRHLASLPTMPPSARMRTHSSSHGIASFWGLHECDAVQAHPLLASPVRAELDLQAAHAEDNKCSRLEISGLHDHTSAVRAGLVTRLGRSAACPSVRVGAVLWPYLVEVPHLVATAALELVGAVEGLLQQGKGQCTSDTTKRSRVGLHACMGMMGTEQLCMQ